MPICKMCGVDLQNKRKDAKTCSNTCRSRLKRQEAKLEQMARQAERTIRYLASVAQDFDCVPELLNRIRCAAVETDILSVDKYAPIHLDHVGLSVAPAAQRIEPYEPKWSHLRSNR